MTKIALFVNPSSGRHRTGKRVPAVLRSLGESGVTADLFVSRSSAHLRQMAGNLKLLNYAALVSMGGDGTHFHLINGLLRAHRAEDLPPLGVIPSGSGNSFARDLGIGSYGQAVAAVVRNRPRKVDLIAYEGRGEAFFFVNLMGLGFVTDVAATAERFKAFHDLSYLVGVIHRALTLGAVQMEVILDKERFSGRFCFVEFCNSRFTGGSMLMAPQARIDDGLMDIVMVRELTRGQLLRALPRIYKGSHLELPQVTCLRSRTAEIRALGPCPLLPDGEVLGQAPGRLEVLPGKLRYLS